MQNIRRNRLYDQSLYCDKLTHAANININVLTGNNYIQNVLYGAKAWMRNIASKSLESLKFFNFFNKQC